ncbi:hypothetical protein KSS87_013800 [Heliosperma pusillum]|nr:hypothetical protein KSS87_013800 [Heliosperma pusillum]
MRTFVNLAKGRTRILGSRPGSKRVTKVCTYYDEDQTMMTGSEIKSLKKIRYHADVADLRTPSFNMDYSSKQILHLLQEICQHWCRAKHQATNSIVQLQNFYPIDILKSTVIKAPQQHLSFPRKTNI